ncbi:hypothetical protein N7468_005019 [Penicillium chermesinum]|uniref:Macro domain-like protein n=1 Tax=Penicillium chermesinum TaxID=63820 RepID=A0A9W9P126_9EURO|nr:uncharacterized protein N7468_005019 [Penicillium chermesinum]KAJ5232063.1 hypothetical protein N7468_005019 [Penicillium chermesinum]KAJ6171730.1 hypothetical protein N7470_000797 [Penicillium chermesinum]
MASRIPEILLLCMDNNFITAFNEALRARWPGYTPDKVKITPINARLNNLPGSTTFDLVVSPANSYGRLDGAFDDAISMAFSPRDDYYALTRAAQRVLYDKWRGYAPPGTCTLVEFPRALKRNKFECKWVALCPTMREPTNVTWDREVVFECIWSLLCQIEGHNRQSKHDPIRTILMTPLATGIGKVSKERWAAQTVVALKQFVEALTEPETWSRLEWDKISQTGDEIKATWKK